MTQTQAAQAGVARQVARLRGQLREMRQDLDDLADISISIAAKWGWNDRRVAEINADIERINEACARIVARLMWLEELRVAA
jgi:hypothetical protein